MTYQSIVIVGNVGKEPEIRYTASGTAVCDFSLAVNSGYTDAQGKKVDKTTWYRVTCWGKLAEIASQYVGKGKQVLVTSDKIEANAYINKLGEAAASLDVTANTLKFLGNRNDAGAGERALPEPDGIDVPF